jgi:hypothetical protein
MADTKDKTTILLYGRSNSGKTPQIGVLSEYVEQVTGGITRLYSVDKGSMDTIKPHIKCGLIEPIEMGASDPFMFLNKAAKGAVRDAAGKWVPSDLKGVGCVAFEGIRSFAEELLMWLADKAGDGVNIGGGSNVQFKVMDGGETLNVGGSNQSHYKVVQDRMTKELWNSLKLNVPYIIWTTSVSKDESNISAGKIVGPDVIGKALTEEVVRWFGRVYRMDFIPAKGTEPEKHILYLGSSIDQAAGGATALGNLRMPLDAPKLSKAFIEPANIVEALKLGEGGVDSATLALEKRRAAAKAGKK